MHVKAQLGGTEYLIEWPEATDPRKAGAPTVRIARRNAQGEVVSIWIPKSLIARLIKALPLGTLLDEVKKLPGGR